MYRVYWIAENGHPREEFCETKEDRDDLIKVIEKLGFKCDWEVET
jgi:hypothetical protein